MITSMTVVWTSLSIEDPTSGTTTITPSSFEAPAVLDSGTTATVVPPDIANHLIKFFGAVPSDYGYLLACDVSSYNGTLNYGFGGSGGAIIKVPFSELVIPLTDSAGKPLTFKDGTPACMFGVQSQSQGQQILFGDTFLRSAYVVYDLDNQQIGLAPTIFNATSSNVQEIPAGNASLSGASSVASDVTAAQTATVFQDPGFDATQSGTLQPTGPGHASFMSAATTSLTASPASSSRSAARSGPAAWNQSSVLALGITLGFIFMGGLGLVLR